MTSIVKKSALQQRKKNTTRAWIVAFYCAMFISMLVLVVLIVEIVDDSFGFVGVQADRSAQEVLGSELKDATDAQVLEAIKDNITSGLYRRFDTEKPMAERTRAELDIIFIQRVIKERIEMAWSLSESILKRKEIQAAAEEEGLQLRFRSWLSVKFIVSPQSSEAEVSGIRTALFGSLYLIVIAVLFAVPLGVGAALYLEEYATKTRLNRLIQVNIYNLAGIPSIVYGLLGLAVFVRLLEPITRGRTILSAGLTLGLMCLPIIIINSQEALRAVPNSLRYSSYGLGATKWQTIWHHVLPYSFERILTGVILAVSRAIGETAPLVVVGAATFISVDPAGIFSKFTALPIQIYQWASRPQKIYQNTAAAAAAVLVIMVLALNVALVIMRNHLSKQEKL